MKKAFSHLVAVPKRVSLPLLLLILVCFQWIPNALRWPARALRLLLHFSLVASLIRESGQWRGQGKRMGLRVAALGLGLLLAWPVAEAGAWLLIRLRSHLGSPKLELTEMQRESILMALSDETSFTQLDATLGRTQRPNSASEDGLSHSNAAGFRALREYPRDLGAVTERVLTFGDSYTLGNDVGDTDTWQHQAEMARPGLEMLNFGVGGFGMTQAYLRNEAEAENFEATGAILGCMTKDLRRSVNVYYPFRFSTPSLAPSAMGSPYAGLDRAGRVKFHPNPLATPEDYRALLAKPASTPRNLARRCVYAVRRTAHVRRRRPADGRRTGPPRAGWTMVSPCANWCAPSMPWRATSSTATRAKPPSAGCSTWIRPRLWHTSSVSGWRWCCGCLVRREPAVEEESESSTAKVGEGGAEPCPDKCEKAKFWLCLEVAEGKMPPKRHHLTKVHPASTDVREFVNS